MEHMSPARLGEAQLAENSWRPRAQVLRPVPHALAHGLQGKIAAPASVARLAWASVCTFCSFFCNMANVN